MNNLKFFAGLLLFLSLSCIVDDEPNRSATPLPEATQEGLKTFGCRVGKETYVKTSDDLDGVYQQTSSGYTLGLQVRFRNREIVLFNFGVFKEIEEGDIHSLQENTRPNAWASIVIKNGSLSDLVTTGGENTGTLTITTFDLEQQIISGTFNVRFKHPFKDGFIEVKEGRFDTRFAR